MVKGIETFRHYFEKYNDSYVIIGGTACDIIQEQSGLTPRATKDIDIILIIEALSSDFVHEFWKFIHEGQYETRQHSNGSSEYFRFMKPKQNSYPFQLELFARKPNLIFLSETSLLTPLPVGEDLSSLSAILMNDEYYEFTIKHSHFIDGLRIAATESLICLKAKAYLDLTTRKHNGENIDEKNIRKHFNDIFRLAAILPGNLTVSLFGEQKKDFNEFCKIAQHALPDNSIYKAAGIGGIQSIQVFERLCSTFKSNLQL